MADQMGSQRRGSAVGYSFIRNLSAKTIDAAITGRSSGTKTLAEDDLARSRLAKPPPLDARPHRGGIAPGQISSVKSAPSGDEFADDSDDEEIVKSLKAQLRESKAMVADYALHNKEMHTQVELTNEKLRKAMDEVSIKDNPSALAALVAAGKRDLEKMANAAPNIEAMAAIASRDEEITNLKISVQKRDAIIRDLKANMVGCQRQFKEVQEMQRKLESEREALKELGKDELGKAELFALQRDELENLKSQLQAQQLKHDEELRRLRGELQKLSVDSMRKIEQLQFYAEAMRKRAAEAGDLGGSEIDALQAKLRELEQALAVSEAECERLRQALEDAEQLHKRITRARRSSVIAIGVGPDGQVEEQKCRNCLRMSEDLEAMQYRFSSFEAPLRSEIEKLQAERDSLLEELRLMRERLAKLLAQGGAPRNADHSECESKINVLTQRLKRITDWHNKEMAMGKTIHLLRPPPPSLYDSFQEVEWLSRARQISTFSPQGPSIFNAAKASRPSTAATIIENESRRLDNMYIAGQRAKKLTGNLDNILPSYSAARPMTSSSHLSLQRPITSDGHGEDRRPAAADRGGGYISFESRPGTADSRRPSARASEPGLSPRAGWVRSAAENMLVEEAKMPPMQGDPSAWGLTPSELLFSSPWKQKDRDLATPGAIGSALKTAGPRRSGARRR